MDAREEGRKFIRQIPLAVKDGDLMQVVLLYRYIDLLTWTEIARRMRFSPSRLYVYHQNAMAILEKTEKNPRRTKDSSKK